MVLSALHLHTNIATYAQDTRVLNAKNIQQSYLSPSQRREAQPGRGLLIPHGYLRPGKREHSEVLRSVMSINNRGRVTMFQGWTSH